MQMKQCQVQQTQNETLYKNHPNHLQSKRLLRALDPHENMMLNSLGQQKQNKYSYEDHVLSKHGLP